MDNGSVREGPSVSICVTKPPALPGPQAETLEKWDGAQSAELNHDLHDVTVPFEAHSVAHSEPITADSAAVCPRCSHSAEVC